MTERTVVLVSRKWSESQITVKVTQKGIGVSMPINQFIAALADLTGNPTLLVTKAQLEKRLQEAAVRVVSEMKSETARAM